MIFKDSEQLSNIYANMLTEAKEPCCPCTIGKKCTKERCECTACKKSLKESQLLEAKKKAKKPDDDGDGVPNWADKKPGKDDKKNKAMKESSMFKKLFMSIINEAEVCGCPIKKGAQYDCVMKDGTKRTLSGDSVLKIDKNKDDEKATMKFKSVKAAHKK